MTVQKRLVLLLGLLSIGILDIVVYWNSHLYYKAKESADYGKRIQVLRRANSIFPWNDRVYYELGKASFDSCVQNLLTGTDGISLIRESSQSFERSLRLNPASPFGHFYYAQALMYEDLLTPAQENRSYKEYKSAAQLAGVNRELFFEVGKRLFGRWQHLNDEDKDFVLDILKTAFERRPVDKFPVAANIWALNVQDVSVMEKIIPESPEIFRRFGTFIGERSFPLADRQRMLSRADYLQLKSAERLLASGERASKSHRFGEASELFRYCLGGLLKIRFFHKISGEYAFDDQKYRQLYKTVNLKLGQSILESDGSVDEARMFLSRYLDAEENEDSLRELDTYLRKHGVSDIPLLLLLYHKQGRLQDMVNTGDRMDQPYAIQTNMSKTEKSRILYILGDAHKEMGKYQEAAAFLSRSIDADPTNFRALLKIRQLFHILDVVKKLKDIAEKIERLVIRGELIFRDRIISKDREFSRVLFFDEEASRIDLYFERPEPDKPCLITIELNRKVVWDGYLRGEKISCEIEPKLGRNTLRVMTVNHAFTLKRMIFGFVRDHRTG